MERGSMQENVDVAANESSTAAVVSAIIPSAAAAPAIIAPPDAFTAASSVAAASAIDTEEVLGSVVYLLTFLGFFAWLMKECRDKTAYVKTACSRIAEFLQFTGNSSL